MTEDYSLVPRSGPSMSTRGGIKLHPLRDGVIPLTSEARVAHRDRGGNVYTEVTNPSTGFCDRVTSPLTIEGGPVLQSQPVVPTHNPKSDAGLFPCRRGGVWMQGVGAGRRVIRTTDMGDEPIPSMPSRHGRATREGAAPRAASGASGASGDTRTHRAARLPTALIDAYIQGLAERKAKRRLPPVKITPQMRKLARLELARQKDIREYCDGKS